MEDALFGKFYNLHNYNANNKEKKSKSSNSRISKHTFREPVLMSFVVEKCSSSLKDGFYRIIITTLIYSLKKVTSICERGKKFY